MKVRKFESRGMATQKNITILIIEDDPICSTVFVSLFQELGIFDITIATSAEKAIELFSKNFDIIFTDFHLYSMNGAEIAKHYRTIFPKKDTPIICCSSDLQLKYQECINAEINGFLSKPYTKEELIDILECWLPQINFRVNETT